MTPRQLCNNIQHILSFGADANFITPRREINLETPALALNTSKSAAVVMMVINISAIAALQTGWRVISVL